MTVSELADNLVRIVDLQGGGDPRHPEAIKQARPIADQILRYVTQSYKVACSPFSIEYRQHQIRLYELISGRGYSPTDGELSNHTDISSRLHAANPYASSDYKFIGDYLYQCSLILKLIEPRARPRILDLGCGTGTTSEILAFPGCHITAFDIDPDLGVLATERAGLRGLDINRITGQFDDLPNRIRPSSSEERFDVALFYASLHHALEHEKLLSYILNNCLSPGGVIIFADEPINSIFWEHWGVRLDLESLYVARKYGWLETGWSYRYLGKLSQKLDSILMFVSSSDNKPIGILSKSAETAKAIYDRAMRLRNYPFFSSESCPGLCEPENLKHLTLDILGTRPRILPREANIEIEVVVSNGTPFCLSSRFTDLPINISYHWTSFDGSMEVENGLRSPFQAPLLSGHRSVCLVSIETPSAPGRYNLVLTLVQEGVLWLENNRTFRPLVLSIIVD
jgi:2-polyprenyl-3-methyl-5-hydroxy-6-metoxy-1,4-benzoquinol methylase